MNLHTLHTDDQHQQISLLLPWYLNQTLGRIERQQVESHIHSCFLCRRELVHLEKLAAAVKQASDLEAAADASFDRLREKLQASLPNQRQPESSLAPVHGGREKRCGFDAWIRHQIDQIWSFLENNRMGFAIVATLLLLIVPFATQIGRSPVEYYTLSDAKPESSVGLQLRVVFKNTLPDTVIDTLLSHIHGQRIDGPNSVGAYTVRLSAAKDAEELANAIAFLRSQKEVMLAEPVLQP